jgi:DNA-binding transcriptional LysR family regulator
MVSMVAIKILLAAATSIAVDQLWRGSPLSRIKPWHGTVRLLTVAHPTRSYWLVHPPGARRNHALQVFTGWLLAELSAQRLTCR